MKLELYYGKVESIDDSQKLSRAQVRILPEMQGATRDDLPWLRPFIRGSMTAESSTHDLPEVGSFVWCIFLDVPYFKDGWYIGGVFVDKNFDFDSVANELSDIDGFSGNAYADLHFNRFEDGTIMFRNKTTKEYGILFSNGAYLFTDQQGNLSSYSPQTIKASNPKGSVTIDGATGNIVLDPGTGEIQLAGSTDYLVKHSQLKAILQGIMANLDARMMIDPLSGMTGTVNPAMMTPVFDPMAQTNLEAMKAEKVKTS